MLFVNADNTTESVRLTVTEGSAHHSADAQNNLETESPEQKKKRGKRKEKVINF
jgi:hypothetical protein